MQDRGEQAELSAKNAVSIVYSIGADKSPFPIPEMQSACHPRAQ
jgi:hypothetical protein